MVYGLVDSHKSNCKLYAHFNKTEWKNVKMILLDTPVVHTGEELRFKENEYIEEFRYDPRCLNTNNAWRHRKYNNE